MTELDNKVYQMIATIEGKEKKTLQEIEALAGNTYLTNGVFLMVGMGSIDMASLPTEMLVVLYVDIALHYEKAMEEDSDGFTVGDYKMGDYKISEYEHDAKLLVKTKRKQDVLAVLAREKVKLEDMLSPEAKQMKILATLEKEINEIED